MRRYIFLMLTVLFAACGSQEEKPDVDIPPQKISIFKELGDLYKINDSDTIFVFSPMSSEEKTYEGVLIDTAMKKKLRPYLGEQMDYGDYFACYRFNLDASRAGLITRAPSEYESSSIDLWIYDRTTDSLYDALRLAESFGDAGETYTQTAWLCKGSKGWACYRYSHLHDEPLEWDEDTTVTDEKTFERFYFKGNKAIGKEIPRDQFPVKVEE